MPPTCPAPESQRVPGVSQRYMAIFALAAVALVATVAVLFSQEPDPDDCCPCAREAAYAANLTAWYDSRDEGMEPVADFMRVGRRAAVRLGEEPPEPWSRPAKPGLRQANVALRECLEQVEASQ